jgi:hypothetical protein
MALKMRTDMEMFLFAVKGKPEHSMSGVFISSSKAWQYLLHGMKKHSSDILKEFESYVLADVEGAPISD